MMALSSVSDSTISCADEEEDIQKTETEYATQYFGFTPKSFTNGVYNAMLEYIKEGLCGIETFINKEFSDDINPSSTKDAVDRIATKMLGILDRRFDSLESYLESNVFLIPPTVILPEDKVQDKGNNSPEESQKMDEEIKQLQDTIIALRYANMQISNDITDIEELQDSLKEMVQSLHSVRETAAAAGVPDIKDMLLVTAQHTEQLMTDVVKLGLSKDTAQHTEQLMTDVVKLGLSKDTAQRTEQLMTDVVKLGLSKHT